MRMFLLAAAVAALTFASCDDKKPAPHQAVEVKAPPKAEAPPPVIDAGTADQAADAGEPTAAPGAAEVAAPPLDAGT